jgi:hypothetical protein
MEEKRKRKNGHPERSLARTLRQTQSKDPEAFDRATAVRTTGPEIFPTSSQTARLPR